MKIGCNYWASNAGTEMWRNWDAQAVERDFAQMEEVGMNLVRVFPIWRDFQPVEVIRAWRNYPQGYRANGQRVRQTPDGRDGVDLEMFARFRKLTEIAEAHHIGLVVGIVTGWMSGTLFVPPALAGRNPITDPLALQFETRFVRRFVREMKDCRAIECWELGNECNCMGDAKSAEAAWLWTNTITSAIRLEDPDRPVASGMHGLMPGEEPAGRDAPVWTIQTQGELCDIMSAHPYPHSPTKTAARVDPHDSIRLAFQATVEMLYYGDVAGKPSAVEEIGTFAPSYCAEPEKCAFLRNTLFNSWAHGSKNFLWWCAYDQSKFDYPPYEWSSWERELGLFDTERKPKPCAEVVKNFSAFLRTLPSAELPPFRRDAVCVLTRGQGYDETMTNGWSSFVLAKQNHFDLRFVFETETLPESKLYIVPGLVGGSGLYKYEFDALRERAAAGATVLYTLYDGSFQPFTEVFGVEVASREARTCPAEVLLDGECFPIDSPFKLNLRPAGAEVLAREKDGNPVFVRFRYGKGWNYLLTLPLERSIGSRPGAFHKPTEPAWRHFYRDCAAEVVAERIVSSQEPQMTLTEHPQDARHCLAVAVNNGGRPLPAEFGLAPGWKIVSPLPKEIAAHDGLLLQLEKTARA